MSYSETRQKGVASFVQATGRDAYWRALAEQRASFLDERGALRAELVEEISCAVCGPAEHRHVFDKDAFPYHRCVECGSIFIARQLREEVLDDYWSTSVVADMWLDVLLTPAQLEFDTTKFDAALAAAETRRGGPGAILDIGCSVGTFLDVARRRGWSVSGVEPGERARRLAREHYDLLVAPSLEGLAPRSFDLVTFWEVVEHTKHPRQLLEAAGSMLKPGGELLTLVGGNAGALANRIMRSASAAFDFARLWYFTPASFERLLASSGFTSRTVEGVLAEVDTAVNYLRYDDPYQPVFDEPVVSGITLAALQADAGEPQLAYKFLSLATR